MPESSIAQSLRDIRAVQSLGESKENLRVVRLGILLMDSRDHHRPAESVKLAETPEALSWRHLTQNLID